MWGGTSGGFIPLIRTILFISVLASVYARFVPQFEQDLEVSAAEPRPVFIEIPKHPVVQSLPLVYEVGTPLSDASEKVEKVLRTPLAFSYNKKPSRATSDSTPGETIVEFYGQNRLAAGGLGRRNLEQEEEPIAGADAIPYKSVDEYIAEKAATIELVKVRVTKKSTKSQRKLINTALSSYIFSYFCRNKHFFYTLLETYRFPPTNVTQST